MIINFLFLDLHLHSTVGFAKTMNRRVTTIAIIVLKMNMGIVHVQFYGLMSAPIAMRAVTGHTPSNIAQRSESLQRKTLSVWTKETIFVKINTLLVPLIMLILISIYHAFKIMVTLAMGSPDPYCAIVSFIFYVFTLYLINYRFIFYYDVME